VKLSPFSALRRVSLAVGLLLPAPVALAGGPAEAEAVKKLWWRSIGPANMGGRVADIAGLPGDPSTYYVVPANGGIFKTVNGGVTFTPIFDKQDIASVGAIAIAPSDSNVIWAGTGEGDPRNSASFGIGVFRSTDGGLNWTHLGLADTERIKRIRVDPKNPDVAYVCALGHAWGPNDERGVFKTADGGQSWRKVLFANKDTGCSDIDMDPSNPRVLYAGMYTHRRQPWRFDSGGGETALHKTTDGGATWKKLTKGLPKGAMDRIGVAVAPSNPEIVYMITETKDEGELFRSEDRGESWAKVNDDRNINFRPFYYSDIRVDPQDPQRVYSLSGSLYVSKDGGRSFDRIGQGVHGDHQSFWIDPQNPKRILSGSDGGFQLSYDGGKTWEIVNNFALSQFYHLSYDLRRPYYVCGGLQDNGSWCGPSATLTTEGIRKDDWYTVGGGDGFFAVPDPSAPHLVYSDSQGGNISLMDTRTGMSRNIHPYPIETGSSGNAIAGYKYRFNWNPPIVISPHDPKTVYYGGNVVFRTRDYGHSWEVISPDLTTDDKSKQQSSGGPVVVDNTAAEFHCTILTIAESPLAAGVIWVGTDDGNIQVTRDGGKSWTSVVKNIPRLPAYSWVAAIEASPFDAGTAYVAVDRHRQDDFRPWAFKTTDYGKTWKAIQGNLPEKGYVHVVREDPKVRDLLYAGTERGVYASWDGGIRWLSLRGENLPPVAVNDLQIHPREGDLILATHGRGVFILDDLTPLRALPQAVAGDLTVFDVRPATRWQMWGRDASLGQKAFSAPNPPGGALVHYYLKAELPEKEKVSITITDKDGKRVAEVEDAPKGAGLNRAAWNLRYSAPRPSASDRREPGFGAGVGGLGAGAGGRFGRSGPPVLPGEYTVTVKAAGQEIKKAVRVELDPRVQVSEADLAAQHEALMTLRGLTTSLNRALDQTESLTKQLTALGEGLQAPGGSRRRGEDAEAGGPSEGGGSATPVQGAITAALDQLKEFRGRLTRPPGGMVYRNAPKLREEISALTFAIAGPMAAPTEPQQARLKELKGEAEKIVAELSGIVEKSVAQVNELLKDRPRVAVAAGEEN
jgi:photosystem II stability/assembly factor-like uncharacterized protein